MCRSSESHGELRLCGAERTPKRTSFNKPTTAENVGEAAATESHSACR